MKNIIITLFMVIMIFTVLEKHVVVKSPTHMDTYFIFLIEDSKGKREYIKLSESQATINKANKITVGDTVELYESCDKIMGMFQKYCHKNIRRIQNESN